MPVLTLRFADPDGHALANTTVGILRAPGEVHDVTIDTDANGQLRLDLSEPGHYEFFVVVDGSVHRAGVDVGRGRDVADVLTVVVKQESSSD